MFYRWRWVIYQAKPTLSGPCAIKCIYIEASFTKVRSTYLFFVFFCFFFAFYFKKFLLTFTNSIIDFTCMYNVIIWECTWKGPKCSKHLPVCTRVNKTKCPPKIFDKLKLHYVLLRSNRLYNLSYAVSGQFCSNSNWLF